VPGELHIAGVGLARGYRNQPGQTAAAFGPNPYGPPGSRMYRSGDVASRRSDGAVQYLGRVDHQLKVRGFRVEPGEVQAAVARHPGVREAVVTARADAQGDTRLVAYLVLAAEARAIASRSSSVSGGLRGDLHRFLASSLPAYMLPSAYVVIDDVPLSPTGKIDRSALPEPDLAEALLEDRFSGPQTPTEEAIAAMWARVLGLERVSRDDNFLEVGGHSLVAAQVVAQLRSKLGVRLPVRMLFEHPVLSEFAAAVDAANGAAAGAAR
jgi:acyl carrier protein